MADRMSKLSEWAKTPTPKTHWKSGQELADELERKRAQRAERRLTTTVTVRSVVSI